jgi:hypothetical protein
VDQNGKTPNGKTPNDMARGSVGDTYATEESDRGISIVDRIALVASFSIAILILVMIESTGGLAMQLTPAAATASITPCVDLFVSESDRCSR